MASPKMLIPLDVQMSGLTGHKIITDRLINQHKANIKYVSFQNMGDNSVKVLPLNSPLSSLATAQTILPLGPYSIITIPFLDRLKEGFILFWQSPGTTANQVKSLSLLFSDENLNFNSSFAPSFNSSGVSNNINIKSDEVGIAKMSQFPNALSAEGLLKVSVEKIVQISSETANWNLSTTGAANSPVVVTKAGQAGKSHCVTGFDVTLSGAASGAVITVELKDGATVIRKNYLASGAAIGASVTREFSIALQASNGGDVSLSVSAGGAGCIVTANLSGYSK